MHTLPIEIISASAGSGKTWTLAQRLFEAIQTQGVRPEAVLATTFTNKAAAELRERVRARLLAGGLADQAQRLGAARIGTVNSVCGQLVGEFAFELGLSPELRVIDENLAARTLRRVLFEVIPEAELEELATLEDRMAPRGWRGQSASGDGWWRTFIRNVMDLARTNGIDETALDAMAVRSADEFCAAFLAPTSGTPDELDGALRAALEQALAMTERRTLNAGATKAVDTMRSALNDLRRGRPLPWNEWAKLAKLTATRTHDDLVQAVNVAAAAHDHHPRLHGDVRRLIELVYAIARRALAAYVRTKAEWGVLDFTDQKVLALQVLRNPALCERLHGQLDLVLVDEFQDTDPLELAIFLRLAKLARRSIWVGDQKQAIYGFKGADPALMEAIIGEIERAHPVQTLDKSWRSRAPLVELTSEVFARAFADCGLPRERVVLAPAHPGDDPQLGPWLETWSWEARNVTQDAAALAAGVAELLEDPGVRVRGVGGPRPPACNDVAVLCRTNDRCAEVVEALGKLGIPAIIDRQGLLATPEAQLVLAALRVWVDPGDGLACATLARLLSQDSDDGDAWLETLLANPGRLAFADHPTVQALCDARATHPDAGPLAAFDLALEALGARERCLAWGIAEARLANLEALRADAVAYHESCAAEGQGCTTAGLIAWLEALPDEGADLCGQDENQPAVVVTTWHGAKGLEWPITILYDLNKLPQGQIDGVGVATDRAGVDLADPLGGRWLRFWPWPYGAQRSDLPLGERMDRSPAMLVAAQSARRESLRLLYVGWTRARDRLVLAARGGQWQIGMLELLGQANDLTLDGGTPRWAGVSLRVCVRQLAPREPVAARPWPGEGFARRAPAAWPPAWRNPSQLPPVAVAAAEPERIGQRIPLAGEPEPELLGQAIHNFLAADRPGLAHPERLAIAQRLLAGWQVAGALKPADLLQAADALRAWLERRWPGARWHAEWPLMHRLKDGSVVSGTADLVGELPGGGLILVDHKTFAGSLAEARGKAAGYSGQLQAYGAALAAATGQPLRGQFVHFPVSGAVVELL